MERPHPFPFRTRKLSSLTPMVLPFGGRVGRRRAFSFSHGIYFVRPCGPFAWWKFSIVRAGSALGIAPPFVMLDVQQHAFAPLMAIWILPGWQVYVTRRSTTVDLRCQGFDKDVKTLTALRVSARGKKKKQCYEGGVISPCGTVAEGNGIFVCAVAHGVISPTTGEPIRWDRLVFQILCIMISTRLSWGNCNA